ncbi:MAG: hypothetical protein ACNI3H_06415 [Halarcobacter ebronensis]
MGKYDLVITMIDEYAHINNTNKIDPKMKVLLQKVPQKRNKSYKIC